MKVALLLGTLNRGGTETLLLDVLNHSAGNAFEVFCVYRNEGAFSNDFHTANAKMYRLTPGSTWNIPAYLRKLRKLFLAEKPDIIHAQQCIDAVYASLASIGLGTKIVQTFHGYDFSAGFFGRLLIRLSLRLCSLNIFVSNSQLEYYRRTYTSAKRSKQVKVYNGINFTKLNLGIKATTYAEPESNTVSLKIGMVGNFVPVRDQMTICRFLLLLHKRGIGFTFLFIGGKDEANPALYNNCVAFCMKNDLMGKVQFLGSRSDVPLLLSQLDAFIYSTDHDSFGIAVIEAIASGIPVFVNDWGVMKEITANGKYATLYKTKDENDLLARFLEFLDRPEKFSKSAIASAAWARQTYSIQTHCNRLNEVYLEVLN